MPIELGNVDTAALPPAQAQKLEQMVHDAAFWTLSAQADAGSPGDIGADNTLRYEVTVTDAGKNHTVSFADNGSGVAASASGALQELVSEVTGGGG